MLIAQDVAVVVVLLLMLAACHRAARTAPTSLAMGGAKSRMTFFVTGAGLGRGGNLGGLAGADAHCQALAMAEGSGDHTWRAYLSTPATSSTPAVNARDRIGRGPWYNAEAELVAADLQELHGSANRMSKDIALTQKGDPPAAHDILTGSRSDGTAFAARDDRTCNNWTSTETGRAQVGHFDRAGSGDDAGTSWNSAHVTPDCGKIDLFYCFAID